MLSTINLSKQNKKSVSDFSRFSKSRESDLYFLNAGQSPIAKEHAKVDETNSSDEAAVASGDFFILKRDFLNKKVPVVRRRVLPALSQEIKPDDIENPRVQCQGYSLSNIPEKKKSSLMIPIYEYQRFRFEETCRKIEEIRHQENVYKSKKIRLKKGKKISQKSETLFLIKKNCGYNLEKNKLLKEKNKDLVAREQKFLPARRRLNNFFVNQLVN